VEAYVAFGRRLGSKYKASQAIGLGADRDFYLRVICVVVGFHMVWEIMIDVTRKGDGIDLRDRVLLVRD